MVSFTVIVLSYGRTSNRFIRRALTVELGSPLARRMVSFTVLVLSYGRTSNRFIRRALTVELGSPLACAKRLKIDRNWTQTDFKHLRFNI